MSTIMYNIKHDIILGPSQVEVLHRKLTESRIYRESQHISYCSLFPPPPVTAWMDFKHLMREISVWPTASSNISNNQLNDIFVQDEVEFIFLNLLLLFCPISLDLIQRKTVEDIQLEFGILLQKYLNKKWVQFILFIFYSFNPSLSNSNLLSDTIHVQMEPCQNIHVVLILFVNVKKYFFFFLV